MSAFNVSPTPGLEQARPDAGESPPTAVLATSGPSSPRGLSAESPSCSGTCPSCGAWVSPANPSPCQQERCHAWRAN